MFEKRCTALSQADEHTFTTLIKTMSYAGRVDDALQVHLVCKVHAMLYSHMQ